MSPSFLPVETWYSEQKNTTQPLDCHKNLDWKLRCKQYWDQVAMITMVKLARFIGVWICFLAACDSLSHDSSPLYTRGKWEAPAFEQVRNKQATTSPEIGPLKEIIGTEVSRSAQLSNVQLGNCPIQEAWRIWDAPLSASEDWRPISNLWHRYAIAYYCRAEIWQQVADLTVSNLNQILNFHNHKKIRARKVSRAAAVPPNDLWVEWELLWPRALTLTDR